VILGLIQTYNDLKRLPRALASLGKVADGIVVLDDGSNDDTSRFLRSDWVHSPIWHIITMPPQREAWMGSDRANRNILLAAADRYQPRMCVTLDADEEFESPQMVREFLDKADPVVTAFGLVQFWGEDGARIEDAPGRPAVRVKAWRWMKGDEVPERRFHCGPTGRTERPVEKPALRILHYGWQAEAERKKKVARYEQVDPGAADHLGIPYASLLAPHRVVPFRKHP